MGIAMKRLAVETLEARDVPARWYAVALDSPTQGRHGESAQTVSAGGLAAEVEVWADSPADAAKLAVSGQVTVGGQTYGFDPQSVSGSPADRRPFLLVPTPVGYEVRLEDLAATPARSDWDYNDTIWTVSVAEYLGPIPEPAPTPVAEPEAPPSEKVGGNFRDQFLKLLAKGGGELPDGWEAHHELVERLKAVWVKLRLEWDTVSGTNGLGVPSLLNTEFNTLYEAWLKQYKFPDYSKMNPEQLAKVPKADLEKFKKEFDKFNAAIREYYKDYIILPTDTLADVVRKREAWQKLLHPTGQEVAGDTQKWKDGQAARFKAIWGLINATQQAK